MEYKEPTQSANQNDWTEREKKAADRLTPDTRFSDAVTGWSQHICRFSPLTQSLYLGILHHFQAFSPEYLCNLTLEHFEHYIAHVLARNTPKTANIHLMALKSFARWLNLYNIACPVTKIKKLPENPANPRILSDGEYQAILSVCKPKEKDVIQLIANTGLRKAQVLALRWRHISPDFKYIAMTGKGRKRLTIALNETCRQILSRSSTNPSAHPIRFLETHRHRNILYRLCERLARRAGIQKFGPHALRHYCFTQLYHKGVPLHFISKIAGHADTRTTEIIYCHIFGPTDLLGLTDCLDASQGAIVQGKVSSAIDQAQCEKFEDLYR